MTKKRINQVCDGCLCIWRCPLDLQPLDICSYKVEEEIINYG